jgi:hypothetical protein
VTVPDEHTATLLAGLRTGDWLDAQTFPPLTWVVPGLVPEGMSLLIGGPKIGKSWWSLDVALAASSGGRALGSIPTGPPRPVLLLALEDGDRRLQDRARQLLGSGEKIPGRLHYLTRLEPNMLIPTMEAWLGTVSAADPEPLVILDTLGKVMPIASPGESAYQRDYRVAGRLKMVTDSRPGMALLVLHHDRKAASDDFVDGVSGTNGIAGAADTILVIQRDRTETSGMFKVTGRDVTEAEYAVTVTDGRWRLDGADLRSAAGRAAQVKVTSGLADQSAAIVRFVTSCSNPVRATDVAEAMDMTAKDAAQYLHRLFKAGKLRRPDRGLYTGVVSVVSVVSDPEGYDTHDTYDTGSIGSTACTICGFPLSPALAASGETTHANCDPDTPEEAS